MKHELKITINDDCAYTINFTSERVKNKIEQLINDYQTLEAVIKIMRLGLKTTTPVEDYDNIKKTANILINTYKNENGMKL